MINYLRRNFAAFKMSWAMRWQQHKNTRRAKKQKRNLGKAIKLAHIKADGENLRQYVLPDWNGNLMPLNKREVERLKRIGLMSKRVNSYHLMKEAYYIANPKPKKRET